MEVIITLWGWLDAMEPALNALTLAGVAFAIYQFAHDRTRGREQIEVVLVCGNERAVLPLDLPRADVTRAEVLGRLGMLEMKEKGKRFALSHLSSRKFLRDLNNIKHGKSSVLEIPCSEEEFFQFDHESIKQA